jgi:hypothetical protein
VIYLEVTNPASLHKQTPESRKALIEQCRQQLENQGIARLERRAYRVEWVLHGKWFTSTGGPVEANTDNWVKPIADAIAEAGGLGKRGRGDNYLDREYSVRTVSSESARACITLY